MAISASCVWEIRQTGSDTNGGGYVSGGTDYSQQDSPQLSLTDVVANGTTTLTSSTGGFTSAMVGNIICLYGGSGSLARTRRQISSVTDSNTIVVDATVATGTGITGKVGGALASPGEVGNGMVAGNVAWIKKAASPYMVDLNTANSSGGRIELSGGGAQTMHQFIGYESSRGDNGRPTLKASVNAPFSAIIIVNNALVANLIFDGNRTLYTNMAIDAVSKSMLVRNCTFQNYAKMPVNINSSNIVFVGCEFTGVSNGPIAGGDFYGCSFHDYVAGNAITGNPTLRNCLFANMPAIAVQTNYGGWLSAANCTFYNTSSHAIQTGDTGNLHLVNCHFDTVAGYAVNIQNTTNIVRIHACSYYNCTSGFAPSAYLSANYVSGLLQVTDGSPLNNPSGGDYSFNNTANRGALLRQTGFPQAFLGTNTSNYIDYGAVRHQDPTGSGGGLLVNPGLNGGLIQI